MKTILNVGVIIVNKKGLFFGYSEKEGFFSSKESFFLEENQKTLNKDIVWFTNVEKNNLKTENLKPLNFFAVSIEDILNYYGLQMSNKNVRIVLRKYYDFVNIFVKNILTLNKNIETEKLNRSIENKRIKEAIEVIKDSLYYKDAIISLMNKRKHNNINILNKYKDTTVNTLLINNFKLHSLDIKYQRSQNPIKSFDFTILTLNADNLSNLYLGYLFEQKNYEKKELKEELRLTKNYKQIMESDNCIFFHIKIYTLHKQIKNYPQLFRNLNLKTKIVSKEEYLYFCQSKYFSVEIIDGYILSEKKINILKKIKKLKEKNIIERKENNIIKYNENKKEIESLNRYLGRFIEFKEPKINSMINENLKLNKLQNYIHSFNYLQILFLNDNFLLNEWIKSQLLYNNLILVEKLIEQKVSVSAYDFKSITINIDFEEKEIVRNKLEDLNLLYPASLL